MGYQLKDLFYNEQATSLILATICYKEEPFQKYMGTGEEWKWLRTVDGIVSNNC
jgi:hypothetical protein